MRQIPIRGSAKGYDSIFDDVSGVGSQTISLPDYLVWATGYQPASANNATLLDAWIHYFDRYVDTSYCWWR